MKEGVGMNVLMNDYEGVIIITKKYFIKLNQAKNF